MSHKAVLFFGFQLILDHHLMDLIWKGFFHHHPILALLVSSDLPRRFWTVLSSSELSTTILAEKMIEKALFLDALPSWDNCRMGLPLIIHVTVQRITLGAWHSGVPLSLSERAACSTVLRICNVLWCFLSPCNIFLLLSLCLFLSLFCTIPLHGKDYLVCYTASWEGQQFFYLKTEKDQGTTHVYMVSTAILLPQND